MNDDNTKGLTLMPVALMPKTDGALAALLTMALIVLMLCAPAIIFATYRSLW